MKLLINFLRPMSGGNFEYSKEMIRWLAAVHCDRVTVLISKENYDRIVRELPVADQLSYKVLPSTRFLPLQIILEFLFVLILMVKNRTAYLVSPNTLIPFVLFRKRMACCVHDLNFLVINFGVLRNFYKRALYLFAARYAEKIFFISRFTESEFIRFSGKKLRAECRVIYNGVQDELLKRRLSTKKSNEVIIFGHEAHKDAERAIDTIFRLNRKGYSLKPVVVGAGENVEKLKLKYRGHGVEFVGFVERNVLVDMIAKARFLFFLSKYEGFGLPVLEGFCLGTVVVISEHAALQEVAAGNAIVMRGGELEEIEKLLNDESMYEQKVVEAKSYVYGFSWSKTFESTFNFIFER